MDTSIETADPAAAASPAEPTAAVAAVLAAAVDQARQAVVEFSGETVGAYLGMTVEDDAAGTHRFLATMPGYQGWQWAVVVAACPGADHATISEVVLVPGPTAILAPPWVPWEQRVKPGDLGPGDLLAPLPDDPRLTAGYLATGDPLIDDTAMDVGFGRSRVLSALGRDDAAQRWHDGDHGPAAAMARSTKRVCRTCGFMVPLAGGLGAMFGVCCNALSADGRVVDYFYGCGAHSDTPAPAGSGSPMYEPYDDGVLEIVAVQTPAAEVAVDAATGAEHSEHAETDDADDSDVGPQAAADASTGEPEQVAEPAADADAETTAETVGEAVDGGQPEQPDTPEPGLF